MRLKSLQLWIAGILLVTFFYVWPGVFRYEYRYPTGRGSTSRYDRILGRVQYRVNSHWEQ